MNSVFQIEAIVPATRRRSALVSAFPAASRLPGGGCRVIENDAMLCARHLLSRTLFADQALATGQSRVRLLFPLFSETALEIVIQYLRIFFFEGMKPTHIDMICDDRQAATARIAARAPNLVHMLDENDEGQSLRWAGRIFLHETRPATFAFPALRAVENATEGPFTAIVVAGDDIHVNISAALTIRQATAGIPAFAAPVYVRADTVAGAAAPWVRYDRLRPTPSAGPLATMPGSTEARDVIEPFGMLKETHPQDFLQGERERLARKLHAAYRQRRNEALAARGVTERADLPDWAALEETYKQANRRAVDFIASVRLAAGISDWWNSAAGLPKGLIADPVALERLARMAHHSWRADRELDGWRQGPVRDSARRLHTDLVDYDVLTEEKKELDREQIRLFAEFQTM
jgi:hypothetical protein